MPADHNPLTDSEDCSAGQLGPVWFLGGPFFPAPGIDFRNCKVPPGKALFFPIINTECSNLEPFPWFGATAEDRLACAKINADPMTDLFAEVDGVPLGDLSGYRTVSPNYFFTAPPNNVLGVDAGSGESVGDGYYLMLAPLSAGKHTIHFAALSNGWGLDVTYFITVGK
jgi:hypothetical protein